VSDLANRPIARPRFFRDAFENEAPDVTFNKKGHETKLIEMRDLPAYFGRQTVSELAGYDLYSTLEGDKIFAAAVAAADEDGTIQSSKFWVGMPQDAMHEKILGILKFVFRNKRINMAKTSIEAKNSARRERFILELGDQVLALVAGRWTLESLIGDPGRASVYLWIPEGLMAAKKPRMNLGSVLDSLNNRYLEREWVSLQSQIVKGFSEGVHELVAPETTGVEFSDLDVGELAAEPEDVGDE
jgi:hypothetical protein